MKQQREVLPKAVMLAYNLPAQKTKNLSGCSRATHKLSQSVVSILIPAQQQETDNKVRKTQLKPGSTILH